VLAPFSHCFDFDNVSFEEENLQIDDHEPEGIHGGASVNNQ
jgi:hypothetical protein